MRGLAISIGMALAAAVLSMTTGCAFSNENPFTGKTSWVIGDACNDCAYSEDGLPTGGQAGGTLSENAALAISETVAANAEIEKAEADADARKAEAKASQD